nr:copper amine oxidase N-terminal domain-containing protein [Cohnella sp. WQ 127256]
MVPIRFVSEALGAEVTWDGKKRSVTIVKDDNRIELVIDQKEAIVNCRRTSMDSQTIIRNAITLVPVRFVNENLNMKVFFDNGEIVITDAKEQLEE